METMENELLEKTKKKLENWELLKKTKEEQVDWFQANVVPAILLQLKKENRVEEIYIYEELFPALEDCLADPKLPEDWSLEGVDPEAFKEQFKLYCSSINLNPKTVEEMAVNVPESTTPEAQFIALATNADRQMSFLGTYFSQLGLIQTLQQKGIPFLPSIAELRMLYLWIETISLLQGAVQNPSDKIIQATRASDIVNGKL